MSQRPTILYGKGVLRVEVAADVDVTVLRKPPMPTHDDADDAVGAALQAPYGAKPLGAEARPGARVAVAICDVTRPVPNGPILRAILRELTSAGVARSDITIVVATGLHRPNEGAELAELMGDPELVGTLRVVNHVAVNDGEHVWVGETSRGTPVWLDRRFVEADVRIVTGLVEPHFMAGYSGGRKVVAPGLAHARTIRRLHSHGFMGDPRCAPCRLDDNPLHQELLAIAALVGPVYAVNAVIDEARRISAVTFGDLEQSHQAAVDYVRKFVEIPVPRRFRTVVTSAAGHPLDATYYQAVKAMVTPLEVLEPGGDLIVAARCDEGLGSESYRRAQAALMELGLERFLSALAEKDAADIDEWQTEMQVRAMKLGRVLLYSDGLSADDRKLTGAEPVRDVGEAIEASLARQGDRSIAVIPEGPYVVPKWTAD